MENKERAILYGVAAVTAVSAVKEGPHIINLVTTGSWNSAAATEQVFAQNIPPSAENIPLAPDILSPDVIDMNAFNSQFTMVQGDTKPFLLPMEMVKQYEQEQEQAVNDPNSVFIKKGQILPSAAYINEFLDAVGASAAGHGDIILEMAKRYNIDPSFKLGTYLNESGGGKAGVARFTKGIGNIRWVDPADNQWANGYIKSGLEKLGPIYNYYSIGYHQYDSGGNGYFMQFDGATEEEQWRASIEADFRLVRYYMDIMGVSSDSQSIITPWAPKKDHNDPIAYNDFVHGFMQHWNAGAIEFYLSNNYYFLPKNFKLETPFSPNS